MTCGTRANHALAPAPVRLFVAARRLRNDPAGRRGTLRACGNDEAQARAVRRRQPTDDDACNNGVRRRAGDGVLRTDLVRRVKRRYEACDDGNEVQTDACLTTCVVATCGDGVPARTSPRAMRVMRPAMMATTRTRLQHQLRRAAVTVWSA